MTAHAAGQDSLDVKAAREAWVRGPARPRPHPRRVPRRDLDLNQHGGNPRTLPARRAAALSGAARPLEDHDLRRGPAPVRDRRAVRAGRTDQPRRLPDLRRACARARTRPRRRRRHGQPRQPQEAGREAIEAAGVRLLFLPPYCRTSTRSRWPSPSSRRSCARRLSARSKDYGSPSAGSSTPSRPMNAPISSLLWDIIQIKSKRSR